MSDRAMQEPTFLILTALAEGPKHGYAITTDVERISDHRVRLRTGTLYAALDRLAHDGSIAADREEVVEGKLRRYYRLTPAGAERLSEEITRMRRHAATAAARLRAQPT